MGARDGTDREAAGAVAEDWNGSARADEALLAVRVLVPAERHFGGAP